MKTPRWQACWPSWGVTADKDLVLDTSGVGQLYGLGPEIALVSTYGTHPIVGAMKRLASGFPIARSLEIKNGDKTTVEKLFESTRRLPSPQPTWRRPKSSRRPPTRKGRSCWAPRDLQLGKEGGGGRFVVVGSSSWVANTYLRLAGNRDLFLNMMNWLSADEDLISIRPKEPEDRRLTMTRSQMALAFYSSVLAIPLLILAAGLSVWWKRR